MPGETAANAMYSRKLVKAKKAGEPLQPIIDKMNAMIQMYTDKSRPKYCTKQGMVDEIVDLTDLRPYIQAFTELIIRMLRLSARCIRCWLRDLLVSSSTTVNNYQIKTAL